MDIHQICRRVLLDETRPNRPVDATDVSDVLEMLMRNEGECASFCAEALSEMPDKAFKDLCDDAITMQPGRTAALAIRAYARRFLDRVAAEEGIGGDVFDEVDADNRSRALDVSAELNYLFSKVL